jgi:hypothetical protein
MLNATKDIVEKHDLQLYSEKYNYNSFKSFLVLLIGLSKFKS